MRTKPESTSVPDSTPEAPSPQGQNGDEVVLGLICAYGSYIRPGENRTVLRPDWSVNCYHPVETLEDRYYCEACGYDYCAKHAYPPAHACLGTPSTDTEPSTE